MLKRLAAGGVAAVVGLGVWGVAGEDHSTRDDSGAIVASGDVGAFVTKLGDCFESVPDEKTVSVVPGVPCTDAHHWQVYDKVDSTLDSYDKALLDDEVDSVCSDSLSSIAESISYAKYETYKDSQWSALFPTSESWDKGDRAIDCLLGSDTVTYYESILD